MSSSACLASGFELINFQKYGGACDFIAAFYFALNEVLKQSDVAMTLLLPIKFSVLMQSTQLCLCILQSNNRSGTLVGPPPRILRGAPAKAGGPIAQILLQAGDYSHLLLSVQTLFAMTTAICEIL